MLRLPPGRPAELGDRLPHGQPLPKRHVPHRHDLPDAPVGVREELLDLRPCLVREIGHEALAYVAGQAREDLRRALGRQLRGDGLEELRGAGAQQGRGVAGLQVNEGLGRNQGRKLSERLDELRLRHLLQDAGHGSGVGLDVLAHEGNERVGRTHADHWGTEPGPDKAESCRAPYLLPSHHTPSQSSAGGFSRWCSARPMSVVAAGYTGLSGWIAESASFAPRKSLAR